ncbi:MAG TPA: DUF5682 family protein [Pseudonocardiaceae bacterium]|jgi:hypothetical protein
MAAIGIGIRHHSPACARLVESTIRARRPAFVLVEGPADMNERMGELLLGHELPVAILSYYRDAKRTHLSWSPFCAYSPEWVALTVGTEVGAQVRFIDLPAWHEAFADRANRYADADARYAEVSERLCREFAVDNVDTLWDHLVEIEPDDGIEDRLTTYFDMLRGESVAGADDTAREAYMARWVRAAVAEAGDRPVVVVTGGFHQPALGALLNEPDMDWPEVPTPDADSVGASYLVPYSFQRLDAFVGYESGMPSPEYYQRVWADGPAAAANGLVEVVVDRLRARKQRVSTADLIAARSLSEGLARLRGHQVPARTDILDGLVSALISEDLDQPLPWTSRGQLRPGAHPVVVEMVAALSGDRVGRLHQDTPAPPLVTAIDTALTSLELDQPGQFRLRLTDERDLRRSRLLHQLRILNVPGFHRERGPSAGADPVPVEVWTISRDELRLPALIEAGAYGATPLDAASARLAERVLDAADDLAALATALFDAALSGIAALAEEVAETIGAGVRVATEIGPLGSVLATVLGLWRHDDLFGTARSPLFGAVITATVTRLLWLVEGVRGGPAPADRQRLAAVVALRDALRHAESIVDVELADALAVAGRIGANAGAPPDLRGAATGLTWSFGPAEGAVLPSSPGELGDWLAGLFALARDELLAGYSVDEPGLLGLIDSTVVELDEPDFLAALPALRQAFAYFPPRERETIARHLLDRRQLRGSARALLRTSVDPLVIAEAKALEATVSALLASTGLAES